MVVPPGWNVTEPIGIAIKLYEIAEKLNHAPSRAKHFKSKIERLGHTLSSLQKVLGRIRDGRAAPLPADSLAELQKEVVALQECIKQCEEFIATFVPLTSDGSKKSSAAAKARWVWDEKKGNELSTQIESHINYINFNLSIIAFDRAHTAQPVDTPREPVQSRSDTLATLPPYTSPKQDGNQEDWEKQPQTPGSILDIPLGTSPGEKWKNTNESWLPSRTVASPEFGPTSSSNRMSGVSLGESSISSPDSRFTPSRTTSGTASSIVMSPFVSPDLLSRDGAERVGHDSVYSEFSLDTFSPQNLLQNLKEASITQERKSRDPSKKPSKKPLETIEVFHNSETNRRCMKISPPRRFNVIYYLDCSSGRAVIPHIEHPEALDPNDGHQVRLEKIGLRLERLPSLKKSETPRMDSLSPPASSAASIMSTSTSVSMSNDTKFHKEDRLMLEFGSIEDYRLFQELVIGPDVQLQAEVPAWEIIAKYHNSKSKFKESSMPYLRLWRRGRFQYLLFHANTSPEKAYKEFRMVHFELDDAGKGKTSIKLRVNLLDAAGETMGLTRPIDTENLKNLEYLLINFEKAKDKAAFSKTATFDTF